MMTPPTARAVSNAPTIPTPMTVDLDDERNGREAAIGSADDRPMSCVVLWPSAATPGMTSSPT
jgi:hypothetical protein